MTELEILRRRRELVVLSAHLQRATLVRRLDHVGSHPLHTALGYLKSAASLSLLLKLGMLAAGRIASRKRGAPARIAPKPSLPSRLASMLRLVPVNRLFPVLRFLNR